MRLKNKSFAAVNHSGVYLFIISTLLLISFVACRTETERSNEFDSTAETSIIESESATWNPQDPVLIELVFPLALKNLEAVGKWATEYLDIAGYSDALELFHWDRHVLVYAVTLEPQLLLDALAEAFPDAEVRWHQAPFYRFDRSADCPDTKMASTWEHHFFTAALVADTIAQRAYMDHHINQREKWPEVITGFCEADFQQLQLFRSDRRLILLISIPAGADFEILNRKTTLNNHRMHEWNELMQEFQEGLPYAPRGTVWVKFKQ